MRRFERRGWREGGRAWRVAGNDASACAAAERMQLAGLAAGEEEDCVKLVKIYSKSVCNMVTPLGCRQHRHASPAP
jgi:hypothetical protein